MKKYEESLQYLHSNIKKFSIALDSFLLLLQKVYEETDLKGERFILACSIMVHGFLALFLRGYNEAENYGKEGTEE